MDYEYINSKQWQSYAKRVERANMKANGQSLTFGGIASRANQFIVELRGEGTMVVRKGWREAMKAVQ